MAKKSAPYISWSSDNLETHYHKRISIDAGCFEDLMNIDPLPMSKAQYQQRSLETVAYAWAEFEAEGRDLANDVYSESRAYFIDDDLVCSITDIGRKTFVTCFHSAHPSGQHFHTPHTHNDHSDAAIGDRRLKFKQDLRHKVQGKLIQNYRPLRGVTSV